MVAQYRMAKKRSCDWEWLKYPETAKLYKFGQLNIWNYSMVLKQDIFQRDKW